MAEAAPRTTVAVVGAGAWGTALAMHLARIGHSVCIWAYEKEVVDEINTTHRNTIFLADFDLPSTITASTDLQEVVREAAIILLVPPSHHFRRIATAAAPAVRPDAMVVVATKGLEESSLSLLSDVLKEVMPSVSSDRLAFLAGPSFAKDVARGLPTDVSVASEGMVAAHLVQNAFHAPHFRVYASDDMVGLQIGGAVKNVMAVACGACDGMDMGTNARAALITRGLAEMTRLGVALGANPLTFLGLTGVGDLVLTSTGDLSRNRTLGLAVGKGEDPKEFLASKKTVAEGYFTAAAAYKLAKKIGVDMPITEGVYQVLHEGRPIKAVAKELMFREPKDELQGIQK